LTGDLLEEDSDGITNYLEDNKNRGREEILNKRITKDN
jgi:hypothetical protein